MSRGFSDRQKTFARDTRHRSVVSIPGGEAILFEWFDMANMLS
jgi:hypothetical protein